MLFVCILTTRFCNFVSADLRKKLRVTFVNAQGLNEPGIDGGGVFREFLSEVLKTGFDPNRGYFCTTPDGQLYPNPQVRNNRALCLADARIHVTKAPPIVNNCKIFHTQFAKLKEHFSTTAKYVVSRYFSMYTFSV